MAKHQKASFLDSLFGNKQRKGFAFHFEEGQKYDKQKNLPKALECYKLALSDAHNSNNRLAEGYASRALMAVYFEIGDPKNDITYIDEALDYGENALRVAAEVGDKILEGTVLGMQGRIYARRMNMHSIGSKAGTNDNPMLHINGTEIQKLIADCATATACHEKSVSIFRGIGDAASTANALYLMAISLDEMHDPRALETAREAFRIWRDIGSPMAGYAEKYIAQLEKRRNS